MYLAPKQSKSRTVVLWLLISLFTWNICFSEKRALLRSRPLELYSFSETKNRTISLVDSMNGINIRNYEGWHLLPGKRLQCHHSGHLRSVKNDSNTSCLVCYRCQGEALSPHLPPQYKYVPRVQQTVFWLVAISQPHWENQHSLYNRFQVNSLFKNLKLGTCMIEYSIK